MTLNEIGIKHNTDKSSISHNFLHHYENVLKNKNIKTVVEVGIFEGGSLRTWAEYFPDANIIGLDIDTSRFFKEDRINCYFCDQSKPLETIAHIIENSSPDLFVDDGSHLWSHQVNTFNVVYPLLKTGAVYIIEDLHTSNYKEYKDQELNPLKFFSWLRDFTIIKNSDHSITGIGIKC